MGTVFFPTHVPTSNPIPSTRAPLADPYYINDNWSMSAFGSTIDNIPGGTTIYPWHLSTWSGVIIPGTIDWVGRGSYIWQSADKHTSWVKAWVSDPLQAQVISGTFDYRGIFDEGNTSCNSYPALRIYVMNKNDPATPRGYLFDGTSSVEMPTIASWPNMSRLYFDDAPLSPVTASAGDKLVVELYAHHDNSLYGNYMHMLYCTMVETTGSAYSLLSFSSDISFLTPLHKSVTLKYDMAGQCSASVKLKYHIGQYLIKTQNFVWNLEGTFMQRDNTNPYRGEYAALIHPPTTLPAAPAAMLPNYDNRWYDGGKSSLNKYQMLDDFEGAAGFADWSYATYWNKIVYSKVLGTYPTYRNLAGYQVLSFYARANETNKLRVYFVSGVGSQQTLAETFVISTNWERYERPITTQSADMSKAYKVVIEADYRGDVFVDDLLVISTGSQNADWIPVNTEKLTQNRPLRYNKIKIPYREGELVQISGEGNANGIITARDLDIREKRFLNETYRDSVPVYFRYRHQGLPLYVTNYDKEYSDITSRKDRTVDGIEFLEIYNSEL